jgi:hypothetical protein
MLDAELQRLRDDNTAIADLVNELETRLAQPLPPEPPFPVMSDMTALQDRVYAMARMVGSMKRAIRGRILQQTLATDFPLQEERPEDPRPTGDVMSGWRPFGNVIVDDAWAWRGGCSHVSGL